MERLAFFIMAIFSLLFLPISTYAATTEANNGDNGSGSNGSAASPPSTGSASKGISTTGQWNQGGIVLNWAITPTGSNYQYLYTLTNNAGQNITNLNDFVLQVNSEVTQANLSQTIFSNSPNILLGPTTLTSSLVANLPSNIYGVEFNGQGVSSIQFLSSFAPAWGSFFANSTNSASAFNTGFATTQSGTSTTNWVPIPGSTAVPVAEPSTILLFSTFLLGLALFKSKVLSKRI